jgi:7-keto-8-aminopelargonate synthetase-like enzyme
VRYARLKQRLEAIRAAGRERRVLTLVPTGPTTARTDSGESLVVACSNDYLGLAFHEEVRSAARGGGSTGSRLLSGSRPVHRQLEEALERWLGRRCLLLGSGYHANLAVFSTLCEEGELVASDEFNHASIIDGLRLSRASRRVVPHADPAAIPADARLVAVEGLYSMDGDIPPLRRYPTEPWLAVDEAHALGCLGPEGRGICALMEVQPDVLIGTFGKALGSAGAFVSGPDEVIDLLVNAARSFIFTTAMPEPNAAMALAALQLATDTLRERLSDNVEYFRCNLQQLGWDPLGEAHIVPILTGSDTMALAARLRERGVFAPGIRWPTVPAGRERIRFTVSAAHTRGQLDQICEALGHKE